MLYEIGTVTKIEQDFVWVAVEKNTTCQSCVAKAGCGKGITQAFAPNKFHTLKIKTFLPLTEGEKVRLAIPENGLILSSFLQYMLPLFCLISAIAVGYVLKLTEGWIILSSFFSLFSGMLIVRTISPLFISQCSVELSLIDTNMITLKQL